MKRSEREVLIKRILEYRALGYTRNETAAAMPEVVERFYDNYEHKLYQLVDITYTKAAALDTEEQKLKLESVRKARKQEKLMARYQELADAVKQRYELNMTEGSERQSLLNAIKYVAAQTGNSEDVVKTALNLIYADFYNETIKEKELDEQYFVELAEKIINSGMSKSIARTYYGYEKMIEYIKTNRPELYEKIRHNYDSHKISPSNLFDEKYDSLLRSDRIKTLVDIMCEFRIPVSHLVYFINSNTDLFTKNNEPLTEEQLQNELYNLEGEYLKKKVSWYLYETQLNVVKADFYNPIRSGRFDEFMTQFSLYRLTPAGGKEFLENTLNCNLIAIKEKFNNRNLGEPYNLTIAEARNVVRYIYNNGLSIIETSQRLGLPEIHPESFINVLSKSDAIEDQMLIEGYKRLLEYNLDVVKSGFIGRR